MLGERTKLRHQSLETVTRERESARRRRPLGCQSENKAKSYKYPRSFSSPTRSDQMGKKKSSVDAEPITADGPKRKRKAAASRDVPPQRSSSYRGVTRHRWTGRFEAHLWDKDCWNETQSKKGKQVYLGAYDDEEAAARAYDLAALKYWGQETILNFPISTYQEGLKEMKGQSREEYIGSLRRKSSGFSRGVSKYRGVARHHHNGRWEARIGRVFGNKYLYLGTYATQEEAAMAYDMAAIEYRGLNAVTNFDLSRYVNLIQQDPNSSSSVDCMETPSFKSNPIAFHNSPPKFEEATDSSSSTTTTEEYIPSPPVRLPASRCSFPDDIQTFFECQVGEDFITDDDTIFGGLGSLPSVDLQFELD